MKYTRAEFSEKTKIEDKNITVYLLRRKLVLNASGEIDDADPVNFMFLQKRMSKLERKVVGNPPKKKEEKAKPEPAKKPQNEEISRQNTNRNELLEMDKEKGKLDLNQRRNVIQMQELELAKKRGELIPTEIVRKLVIQQSEGTKIAYTEACENLIVILSQKKQMTSDEVSDIRKQFMAIVNSAIDTSIEITKRNMVEIVKEFSQKRGVGQHG